jgi:hypothetical protein
MWGDAQPHGLEQARFKCSPMLFFFAADVAENAGSGQLQHRRNKYANRSIFAPLRNRQSLRMIS